MVSVAIQDQTARHLVNLAQQQATSLDNLVEQAIRTFLRLEAEQILKREAQAFEALHPELMKQSMGKYVAVHQGQVIDSGANQTELILRVEDRFPDEVILIRQVRLEVEPIFIAQSPRLIRV